MILMLLYINIGGYTLYAFAFWCWNNKQVW
jgi:hypothetical protein